MEFGPRKIEKRNRAPVSCEPCRARKQMCNRGQPCEACTRRNQASLCRYAPNAIRNKPRPAKVGNIQERLDNLESMLSSIAANPTAAGIRIGAAASKHASFNAITTSASYQQPQQSGKSTQSRQDDQGLPPELPHRHESGDGQINYIDPSHWRAILEEIKEVREHLSAFDRPLVQDEPERKSVAPEEGVGFMFGKFPVVDLEEVLSSLPSRPICDALVAQYFNARFMVLGILHPVKFQKEMGFPSMIPTEFCDTKVPRNLQFSDLDIGMTALPPGRPLFENTPIRYPIAKSGIMAVFKKIVAHSQSLALPTYDNTIMLDNEMREAYSALPEILRGRDVGRSFMDPSSIIFERCTLEMLYLKGLIVLHRRYISYEVDTRRFEHSRRTCAEAALDILARQADLSQASQPGGRLYDDRWMVSSLTMHDFLLAAMVICLDLSVRLRRPSSILVPGRDDDPLTGREYHALQTSQKIWASNSQTSSDARLASLALGLMIQKVAEKDARHIPPSDMAANDLASASSAQDLPYAGPMSQMIDGTEGLDWGLLDQYFQNQPTDATHLEGFNIDPSWFDLPQQ
ncbi:hypothetical protein TrVFT333_002139 [Trichoderma virens FT-333]|nr:hypothetical protein TrVFT333_002139 [Trichoderma virens FT-333]